MNKLMLWLVGNLAWLWRLLGADPVALHHILEAKLKIGERSVSFMGQLVKKDSNMKWILYFFLLLIGVMLLLVYIVLDDRATGIGIALTLAWVYLGFMLVTEMSTNVFDLRDLTVLLSRPISDATFSLSRALHIMVYAAKFSTLLLSPLSITVLVTDGILPALLYLVVAVMLVVITVAFTLGFYLTMLRRVPAYRFRQVVGYVQIVLTAIFFMAYQLPNLFNLLDIELQQFDVVGTAWGFLTPGFWLAALFDVVLSGDFSTFTLLQATLGIAAVIFGVYYYLRQGEGYGERLLATQLAGSQNEAAGASTMPAGRSKLTERLAGWLTRPGVERASFYFNWAMMTRDFKFKQQVYPGLVLLPLAIGGYVLYQFFTGGLGAADQTGTITLLGCLYLFALLLVSPLNVARTSDQFAASWVLHAHPLERPGELFYGQLIAIIGQFFLPIGGFIYLLVLLVGGIGMLDDILLSAAVVLIATAIFQQTERTLPFSLDRSEGQYDTIGPMLLVMFVGGLAGAAHFALTYVPYGVAVAAVVVWVGCFFTYREMRGG